MPVMSGTPSGQARGPSNDPVVRATIESNLDSAVDWLGEALGLPLRTHRLEPQAARLPMVRGTRELDLLVRVGDDRLLQVEYETQLRNGLSQRMLEYRYLVMAQFPGDHLTQVVLALGKGRADNRDDPTPEGYRLGLTVLRMSEQDPGQFLSRPGLAPLAILADSDKPGPQEVFRQALVEILRQGGEGRETALITLMTLATPFLTLATMKRLEEEAMLSEAEIIRGAHEAPFFARMLREAETSGREEGREEGLEQAYEAMLAAKFGESDDVATVAASLADLPRAQAARAVLAAQTLEQVLTER